LQRVEADQVELGAVGFEPHSVTGSYSNHLLQRGILSGAESGAVERQPTPDDPDLRRVIGKRLKLPAAVRAGILAIVQASTEGEQTEWLRPVDPR
jgi:hypothetical protein